MEEQWPYEDEHDGEPSELQEGHKNYHKNLLDRFDLVNHYCDTRAEPLTFNSVNKIWFGGQDVLDYVVCYATTGNASDNVPDHWHYVSFGLSDIHGNDPMDNQSHSAFEEANTSGLGFELTFRLKAQLEGVPPTWPVDLLQKLAKYINSTPDTLIVPGDHITWHAPLHGNTDVPCEINHMLVAPDATIPKLETPTGSVTFHQIVGITYNEVEIAQRWNANALLNLFRQQDGLGGKFLVTDIFRKKSVTELYSHTEGIIQDGINRDGSDLNGVGGRALWTQNARFYCHESHWWALSEYERKQYIHFESTPTIPQELPKNKNIHPDNDVDALSNRLQNTKLVEEVVDDQLRHDLPKQIRERIIHLNKVHLTMSPETARLLPLALKGRVDHKRHFTIKDSVMEDVITFVPKGMPGSFTSATKDCPFAACGPWLHVQLNQFCRNQICEDLDVLFSSFPSQTTTFPKFIAWPDANLAITILEIKD